MDEVDPQLAGSFMAWSWSVLVEMTLTAKFRVNAKSTQCNSVFLMSSIGFVLKVVQTISKKRKKRILQESRAQDSRREICSSWNSVGRAAMQ